MSSSLQLQPAYLYVPFSQLPGLPVFFQSLHELICRYLRDPFCGTVFLSAYFSVPLLGLFMVPGRFRCFPWEITAAVRMWKEMSSAKLCLSGAEVQINAPIFTLQLQQAECDTAVHRETGNQELPGLGEESRIFWAVQAHWGTCPLEAMSDSYPTLTKHHMLRNLMWAQWARFAFRLLPPHTSQTMQKGPGIKEKAAPGSHAPCHWRSCRFLLPYAAGCSGREGSLVPLRLAFYSL